MIGYAIAFIIGSGLGFMVAACLCAAGRADELSERVNRSTGERL